MNPIVRTRLGRAISWAGVWLAHRGLFVCRIGRQIEDGTTTLPIGFIARVLAVVALLIAAAAGGYYAWHVPTPLPTPWETLSAQMIAHGAVRDGDSLSRILKDGVIYTTTRPGLLHVVCIADNGGHTCVGFDGDYYERGREDTVSTLSLPHESMAPLRAEFIRLAGQP